MKGRLKTETCPNTNQRVIKETSLGKYLSKWSKNAALVCVRKTV